MKTSATKAFTLLELLVVIGLIAALSFFLAGGLGGTGKSVALMAGQTSLSSLLTSARTKAVSSGKRTRILVAADVNADGAGFLRTIVLQQGSDSADKPTSWVTCDVSYLPEGVYVVPRDPTAYDSLLQAGQDWRRPANTAKLLGSSLFYGAPVSIDINDGKPPLMYQGVMFTQNGTLANLDGSGANLDTQIELIVATGRAKSPAEYQIGQSPVLLTASESVRGMCVSSYGVPALINDRMGF